MSKLTNKQRAELVANAMFLDAHASRIGYAQERPFPLHDKATLTQMFNAGESISMDCSGFVTLVYYLTAGVSDPTGCSYAGDGNSESFLTHLTDHYTDPSKALRGAIVVFGADLPLGDQHACMVTKPGANPTLVSHGSPGVKILTLAEEQTAHSGATVFVSPAGL